MAHKVVAHFIDHGIVKGTSMDVDPSRPVCHVHTDDRGVVEVSLEQVKALFFVKDFGGQPDYNEQHAPAAGDPRLRGSHAVEVTFRDGERLGGLMNRFPPQGPFFFMLPLDPASNNVRILVNRDAIEGMKRLEPEPAADATSANAAPPRRPRRTTWVFDGKGIREVSAD